MIAFWLAVALLGAALGGLVWGCWVGTVRGWRCKTCVVMFAVANVCLCLWAANIEGPPKRSEAVLPPWLPAASFASTAHADTLHLQPEAPPTAVYASSVSTARLYHRGHCRYAKQMSPKYKMVWPDAAAATAAGYAACDQCKD